MTDDLTNPKDIAGRDRAPMHPPMPEPTPRERLAHALESAGIGHVHAERIADAVALMDEATD